MKDKSVNSVSVQKRSNSTLLHTLTSGWENYQAGLENVISIQQRLIALQDGQTDDRAEWV